MRIFEIRLKPKILGEHTGASPETYLSIAQNVLAVTPLLFFILIHFKNANTKWSKFLLNRQLPTKH